MLLSSRADASPGGRLLRALDPVAARARALPPPVVLAAGLTLAAGVWAWLQRVEPYLGHDESVYAGQARAWLIGTPAVGWGGYRPVGLPLLGTLALRVSDSTGALRAVGLALTLLTLAIVYLVGARVSSPRRAAVAVLVVLSGATFLRRLPEFLDDIPSAGLLLLSAYLVLRSRRPGGRWALPAAAAVGVLAVLVRYGAAAGLVSIAAAGVLAWGPRVWLRAWREVAAALAVLAAGLAPLAVYSHRATGSWIGVLVQAGVVAHRAYLGQGLVYYVQAYPYKLAGVLGAVVAAAGALAALAAARRLRRADPVVPGEGLTGGEGAGRGGDRERLFLGLAAVLELLLLGVIAHGESRFALFTMITLIVLGVDAVGRAAGRWAGSALLATAVLAVAATGATAVLVGREVAAVTVSRDAVDAVAAQLAPGLRLPAAGRAAAGRAAAGRAAGVVPRRPGRSAATRAPAARAATARAATAGLSIPRPGGGSPCLVITRLSVEAAWVSGCDAREPTDVRALPAAAVVYVIEFPDTPGWSWSARLRRLAPDRTWSPMSAIGSGGLGRAVIVVSPPVPSRAS